MTPREMQGIIDRFWRMENEGRPPRPPRLVCRKCGKGPLDGVTIYKLGGFFTCRQHPVKHRI